MWADVCKFGTLETVRLPSGNARKTITFDDGYTYCKVSGVTRDEFYKAAATVFNPTAVIVVRAVEYQNQKYVQLNGQTYTVIRSYFSEKARDNIELTLQRGSEV